VYRLAYARQQGAVQAAQGLPGAAALGYRLRRLLVPLVAVHGIPLLLASEAAHAGRNAQTGLRLSRWGGALAGPMEHWAPHGVATWVEPSEWRKALFRPGWWGLQAAEAGCAINRKRAEAQGLPVMKKREAAKREARRVIPGLVPGLSGLVARLPDKAAEHVYDAAGVCWWHWTQERT
jgi:hypothetical protein